MSRHDLTPRESSLTIVVKTVRFLHSIRQFFRRLFRGPSFKPGQVEDTPETVLEIERRRGMRGF